MSRNHNSARAAEEVARRLAPLARAETEIPSASAVYWRAQARLTIDKANRRRESVLRPLRVFSRVIGGGAIALGALASVWPPLLPASPGAELFAIPVLVALVTIGAFLLAETAPAA